MLEVIEDEARAAQRTTKGPKKKAPKVGFLLSCASVSAACLLDARPCCASCEACAEAPEIAPSSVLILAQVVFTDQHGDVVAFDPSTCTVKKSE